MEKTADKTSFKPNAVLMLCVLAFYAYIAFCVPYCHDDWDWGLDIGLQNWLHATLNSRYAGSFFAVAMTRSELFKTAVIALTMFSIPLLMAKFSARREGNTAFVLANVLMLIVPQLMWQQTYGWVSAFANFVIPAPLLLLLALAMEDSLKGAKTWHWLCPPLALILCLFSENLTVYLLFVSLAFTVFRALKEKRLNALCVLTSLACVLGFLIMFSSPVYGELLSGGSAIGGIRRLSAGPGSGLLNYIRVWGKRFFTLLLPMAYYHSPIAPACASLALIANVLRRKTSAPIIALSLLTAALNVCVCLGVKAGAAIWAVPLGLSLCLLALVLLSREELGKKLFLLLSVPAIILPLAVAEEQGPRLFFLPYMFFMCLALISLPEPEGRSNRAVAFCAALLALAACFAFYGRIYTRIRSVTEDRAQAIASAVENGEDRVIIKYDPDKYWWGRNPTGEERVPYFKEFYGIPEEMEVIFEEPPG